MADIKNIDIFQTVTSVSFEVEPNTNIININKVTVEAGGLQDLQSVTNVGANTTNPITIESGISSTLLSGDSIQVIKDSVTKFVVNQEGSVTANQIKFNTTPTEPATAIVGSLIWNDTAGTLDLKLKGGNTTLQIGQETVARIVNKTATNITLLEANYQVVRVTGAQGQRPKVDLALANNDLNSTTTLGLVTETILNNQEGFVTTSGQVQEINTTGSLQGETWSDGDMLYLSGTVAGRVTNIKPVAPTHTVIIGFVEYAHEVHGKIFVKVDNGYELDELHNVSAIAPNNNEVLTYDTPTLLWKPKPISTALGYTPVASNTAITTGTKTKITYDSKGLVTNGTDATTADIADSLNKRYVTDAQQTVITNTSGTNTGDNATNTQYSGLATSKVNVSDVINTLASTETAKPLSANQGRVLDLKIAQGIVNWTAKAFLINDEVSHLGKLWQANAAIISTDVPGTSSKWVEVLSGYLENYEILNKADLIVGKNKFNKATAVIGFYLSEINVVYANSLYDYSEIISILPSTQYVSNSLMRYVNYYDINNVFLSGISLQNVSTFTSPSNAYFVKVTITHTNLNAFQLEIGSVTSVYESYKKIVTSTQIEDSNYVKFNNIVNNLNSSSSTDALSLAGAKELNDKKLDKTELNSKIFNINAYSPNLVHQYYDDSLISRKQSSTITYAGTIYYVDASKTDDTGNGLTPATAKRTITAAYNLSSNGSIIQLADGTYNLSNESSAYLLLNTNSKGVLIRGNLTDKTLVTLNQSSGTYGIRLRDCGNIKFESLTISVAAAINGVFLDFNTAYSNRTQVFSNVKFIISGTGHAFQLSGSTPSSTDAYFIEFNSCLFELSSQTVSNGIFNFFNTSSFIEVLMKNNVSNITNRSAIYNTLGKAKLYVYDNIFNVGGDVVAVGYGLDGYAPNTIPFFDFRGNKIIYANGFMQHALLLGGGLMTGNIINNYIYMSPTSNPLALGIVIKPMVANLGDMKIYGNYVKAPRPFYIKGGAKNDLRYNSGICNYTGRGAFEYVNYLDGSTDRLSENNNIECNSFIGLETAIVVQPGGTSQAETVTIKTCIFKDNRYFLNANYMSISGVNYTWENRNSFWASINEIDSVRLAEFHLPIRLF